jgi:hypothetical protein
VAIDWVRGQAWADSNKIGLFGISFGAATIMDALVLDAPGKMPCNIEPVSQTIDSNWRAVEHETTGLGIVTVIIELVCMKEYRTVCLAHLLYRSQEV